MSSPAASVSDGLDLESLDADSLFEALTHVEKAVPELLSSIKPILAHLTSSGMGRVPSEEETSGMLAREGVERYMTLLDRIQFILRQTVYYLRETRVSPQTLRPPPINNIPTPFASTLPLGDRAAQRDDRSEASGSGSEPQLGLYASRIESRLLDEMKEALVALRGEGQLPPRIAAEGELAGRPNGMDVDS
ncbi:hypothetical protein IAU60_001769 [Kwoniella sp. DSM 27419]